MTFLGSADIIPKPPHGSLISSWGERTVVQQDTVAGWTTEYNINADILKSTVTGSGTVTDVGRMAVLSTTAATSSSAKISTHRIARYVPGLGMEVRFSALFTIGVANSTQIIGVGDATDGYFFGYNGVSFGVLVRSDSVDSWTALADWNLEQPSITTTFLNVFQITYQMAGATIFSMEDRDTGEFIPVHIIRYANTAAVPQVLNPTFPAMAQVTNTTNNTDIVLKTPEMMVLRQGFVGEQHDDPLLLHRHFKRLEATVTTTEGNLISVASAATFQSIANHIETKIRKIEVITEGTKAVTVRLLKNTTLGGAPSYTNFNANTSGLSFDIAGTTVSGGDEVAATIFPLEGRTLFDLHNEALYDSGAGDIYTITGVTSTATSLASVIIDVTEGF